MIVLTELILPEGSHQKERAREREKEEERVQSRSLVEPLKHDTLLATKCFTLQSLGKNTVIQSKTQEAPGKKSRS